MTYIDPAGKVLSHLDRVVAWQRGETPAPVTIEWDLSNACSLGCQDCHFSYTHVKGPWVQQRRGFPALHDPGYVVHADLTVVMRALGDVRAAGVQSVVWTGGGEPTLHPQWLDVLAHAHALGLQQGMYTHGGHLTRTSAAQATEQLTWIVISLDACDADTYAREKRVPTSRFTAACQGVRWSVGRKAVVGVSFLLHQDNWTRARDMVDLARTLGATYTTLRPSVRTSPGDPGRPIGDRTWITDALPLLDELSLEPDVEVSPARFAQYRDWQGHGYTACRGITLNTTITPDGRVWICPNRREHADSCLGDLKQESFAAIWARHPGQWTDFRACRTMCRLHTVNQQLEVLHASRPHQAFV